MRLTKTTITIIAVIAIFISSCETQTAFRSEKKLNQQIQAHTWSSVKLNPQAMDEDWLFQNGTVYRTIYNDNGSVADVDTGSYSIDAKLSHTYLTIRDFRLQHRLNARWNIVELTKSVLAIAYKEAGTGVNQREFVKK